MSEVELNNIIKIYPGGTKALDNINLKVLNKELLVILGPSGCGKSTLLRTVAGLEKTTQGKIIIDGDNVTEKEPGLRDIAMVFQNYALYPHMNVYKNISYGLQNRKFSKFEIDKRVKEVAESLKITDYLDRKPNQLSGGQRQRVAMGRAIARNPKVFLFDEPLSNLDAKLRIQVRLEISKLQAELGVTSLYVTHDQVEAMTLGHRLVLMNDGKIEQVGEPIEIYNYPKTIFVASFIGTPPMNLLPAEINGNGELLLGPSTKIQITDYQRFPKEITIGIRPEHLLVNGYEKELGKFSVENFERQGADNFIYGKLEGCPVQITIRVRGDSIYSIGDRLVVGCEQNKLHFFENKTGLRIN